MFTSRIKRRMNFDSPKMTKKSNFSKLSFDDEQDTIKNVSMVNMVQPKKLFIENIDENSCGSAFSEHGSEMDDQSVSSDLDDSFSLSSNQILDNNLSNFKSPFSRFRLENESPKTKKTQKLIGDMSREHTLPMLSKSRHSDLASIEPKTLVDLLNGKYDHKIGKYIILDARYPYEFDGGHVTKAQNAFHKEQIMKDLFEHPITSSDGKPVVIIFHCEFSIERGPKLMREFREKDRSLNKDNYPNLFYPEIYLLEGGYKQFFEQNIEHCEPKSYLPMTDDSYRQDMKFFRKKSKTWESESRKPKFSIKTKLDF